MNETEEEEKFQQVPQNNNEAMKNMHLMPIQINIAQADDQPIESEQDLDLDNECVIDSLHLPQNLSKMQSKVSEQK